MPDLKIYNIDGKETDKIALPDALFKAEINEKVIHDVALMYRSNLRQGNASTKTRGEVSGSNRKPFKQKGTGRARQGSSRSPVNHGGGVVFGPHTRDFSYSVPRKVRIAALRECLNSKFQKDDLRCVDQLTIESGKTKDFIKVLSNLNISEKVVALMDESEVKTKLATRNLSYVNVLRAQDVNALDLLNTKKVLVTKASFETLLERLK